MLCSLILFINNATRLLDPTWQISAVTLRVHVGFFFPQSVSQYAEYLLKRKRRRSWKQQSKQHLLGSRSLHLMKLFVDYMVKKKESNGLVSEKRRTEPRCLDWQTHNLAYICTFYSQSRLQNLRLLHRNACTTKSMRMCVSPHPHLQSFDCSFAKRKTPIFVSGQIQ